MQLKAFEMNNKQYFLIHIYYNDIQSYKILFDWLLPLYENYIGKNEEFEFMYFSDFVRGRHLKLIIHFKNSVEHTYFENTIISTANAFLKENPSEYAPTYVQNFLMEFPNNSVYEFEFNEKIYFTDNVIINKKILNAFFRFTPHIMQYRLGYDVDTILTISLVISNTIISSFTNDDSEKEDFFTWYFKTAIPTVDTFSKKDTDIRKQKQKEIKELQEGLRRSFIEQKQFITNLIDSFLDIDEASDDLKWLHDFSVELKNISSLLDFQTYTVPENFRYESVASTRLEDQEKWPIIESILSYIYNSLGCSDILFYNILYSLKEYYKSKKLVS